MSEKTLDNSNNNPAAPMEIYREQNTGNERDQVRHYAAQKTEHGLDRAPSSQSVSSLLASRARKTTMELIVDVMDQWDIFGQSKFRNRMKENYRVPELVLSFLFQLVFFAFMVFMGALLCNKVMIKQASVSREMSLWFGYAQCPEIAVAIHDYAGTAKHFSVRAQRKRIFSNDYVGREKIDIPFTKCRLKLHGDYEEEAFCLPTNGDEMTIGQTYGQEMYRYIDIKISADKWPIAHGHASLYIKNYIDMNNPIWDSHYYNLNSGYFSTAVEVFFRKVVASNFLRDVSGFQSYEGMDEITAESQTYLQFDHAYSRMMPFDTGNVDPAQKKIKVISFTLRSSLSEYKEKYIIYNVLNLLEDFGGLSSSIMIIFGLLFIVLLRSIDRVGNLASGRHGGPLKKLSRHANCSDKVVPKQGYEVPNASHNMREVEKGLKLDRDRRKRRSMRRSRSKLSSRSSSSHTN